MERVVTINLNGNPYQLEEPAYDALRAYMSRAEAALADNPDKAEIIRDLEQAIADKCASYLSPGKTVISAAEMTRVLGEMGPVEGDRGEEQPNNGASGASTGFEPRKRLYRVKDRAVVSGVCSGIGAYFDLDPNIIRLIFVLFALFTSGFGIIVYVILMFAIPSAHTSEEWAAAHGVPFNAQEIIDRAKREYSQFTDDSSKNWKREERHWRSSWRRQQREWNRSFGGSWHGLGWDANMGASNQPAAAPAQPVGYVTRIFAGLFALIFSVITAALLIAFLFAFFSLLSVGAILGWAPPADVPLWLSIVVLAIAYAALSSPFSALRRSSYATLSGYRSHDGGADGLVTLVLVALAVWISYLYWPEARDLIQSAPDTLRQLRDMLRN
jgi:phage shock protein PspC (stress-responsive transcriptional regulator)